MQWWCSAVGTPWSWSWRPYPGVWLFVALMAVLWFAMRRVARRDGEADRGRAGWWFAGLALLWLALDWPVGALAGYLASAHMAQFLLIAFAAPPLLWLGVPGPRTASARAPGLAVRVATHPLVALVTFNVVVVATHLPVVTDRLMPSQAGSFAIDVAWLGAGALFWWPVLRDRGRAWLTPPVKIAYLFANMVLMTAPGAMITFSELPVYATYELAPPIPGITPLQDQRLAGLNMRVGAAFVIWLAISILFRNWSRDEERLLREEAGEAAARGSGGA